MEIGVVNDQLLGHGIFGDWKLEIGVVNDQLTIYQSTNDPSVSSMPFGWGSTGGKAKMEPLDAGSKSTMDSELEALEGGLYGVRQVTGTQFSKIVAKIDQVTSFSSTSVIGMTKERAYLEVKFYLASNRSYVVIVCAPLGDLPTATRNKLQELLAIKTKDASKEK